MWGLKGGNQSRKNYTGTKEAHKLDMDYYLQGRKLTKLTGNLPPKALLKEMCKLGQDDF